MIFSELCAEELVSKGTVFKVALETVLNDLDNGGNVVAKIVASLNIFDSHTFNLGETVVVLLYLLILFLHLHTLIDVLVDVKLIWGNSVTRMVMSLVAFVDNVFNLDKKVDLLSFLIEDLHLHALIDFAVDAKLIVWGNFVIPKVDLEA